MYDATYDKLVTNAPEPVVSKARTDLAKLEVL